MPLSPETRKRWQESLRPKPDEYGFLGVPGGGSSVYRGTTEADGYIYDIPGRDGYLYCRLLHGTGVEVGACIAGGVARDATQKIGFYRQGPVLIATQVSPLGAVIKGGKNAGGQSVAPHTHPITDMTWIAAPTPSGDGSLWVLRWDSGVSKYNLVDPVAITDRILTSIDGDVLVGLDGLVLTGLSS